MNIISFDKLDSTNTYAKLNIDSLADKTVISADYQTNGRGRFDRKWVDLGSDNIYMSIVLKPFDEINPVCANFTQYLSVVLCRQLDKFGLTPQIKWPNDVLVNGKKICGILAKAVIKKGKLKGIVLGIGINLKASSENLSKIDRPATSLNLEIGKSVDKNDFMNELLNEFFSGYDDFVQKGFLSIKEEYESRNYLDTSAKINVAVFNLTKSGIFRGFDKNANLLLENKNAEIENINMGELVD